MALGEGEPIKRTFFHNIRVILNLTIVSHELVQCEAAVEAQCCCAHSKARDTVLHTS